MRGTFFRGTNFMLISPPSLKYVTPIPSSLCEVSDPHKRINLLKYSNKRYQMIKYLLLTHRRMGSLCVKRRENDCTIPVTYCSPQLHVNIVILLHQDQFPSAILSFGCHFLTAQQRRMVQNLGGYVFYHEKILGKLLQFQLLGLDLLGSQSLSFCIEDTTPRIGQNFPFTNY